MQCRSLSHCWQQSNTCQRRGAAPLPGARHSNARFHPPMEYHSAHCAARRSEHLSTLGPGTGAFKCAPGQAPEARREALQGALAELLASLLANTDFPEGQMAIGGLAMATRNRDAASAAFAEATFLDPSRCPHGWPDAESQPPWAMLPTPPRSSTPPMPAIRETRTLQLGLHRFSHGREGMMNPSLYPGIRLPAPLDALARMPWVATADWVNPNVMPPLASARGLRCYGPFASIRTSRRILPLSPSSSRSKSRLRWRCSKDNCASRSVSTVLIFLHFGSPATVSPTE